MVIVILLMLLDEHRGGLLLIVAHEVIATLGMVLKGGRAGRASASARGSQNGSQKYPMFVRSSFSTA